MDTVANAAALKPYRRGTHRARSPEETLARVRPFFERFGITRVANLTGLDRIGIPVVMVCRPNARSSAVFHGKGLDLAAAKASGVMEAIETWHAEHSELPLRLARANELAAKARIVDVDGLPRRPGDRFHRDLTMLWIQGRDLASGEPVWVPFDIVHADGTLVDMPGSGCFAVSTNGLASGNHLLEATSHALCEVIERDATSLWHQSRAGAQDAGRLDLASVDDPACRDVLERFEHAEIDVGAWDITSDVGVPTFVCTVVDRKDEYGHVGRGGGCHPTREIALLRALTEAAQVRTTYIVGSREDIDHDDYRPETLRERHQRASLLLRAPGRQRAFAAVGRFEFETFDAEVAWIVERLRAAGMGEAIAVDLTRPEFGIAVVRVVVPGLEGSDHHTHYVPGKRAGAVSAVGEVLRLTISQIPQWYSSK